MQRRDLVPLLVCAAMISLASFFYFFRHDQLLLYGDAVAHINIARRVFDSQQPGPVQLGTVWLPLPHVLTLPFIVPDWAWRTGAGAAVVSTLAYLLGAVGVFRLVNARLSRGAAWFAAIIYLANPSLIYLQTTAMNEALYLALLIWALLFLCEFLTENEQGRRLAAKRCLRLCWLLTAAMMLTRYDGWFAAACFTIAIVFHLLRVRGRTSAVNMRDVVIGFLLPLAFLPMLWLSYNRVFFEDAWAFARGPYSARAIIARSGPATWPTHPGDHDLRVAATYFIKAAELNVGDGSWGRAMMTVAFLGAALTLFFAPLLRVFLLLWIALPFYALSMVYAGVPIFIPTWWPFSYYNLRYGLELLPAVAVFCAIFFVFVARSLSLTRLRLVVPVLAAVLVVGSYASTWRSVPICLREARANSLTRIAFERQLASELMKLPSASTIMMYTGDHVGALQRAGIHLRRTVNETLEVVWERSLSNPAQAADYVVALEGDPVWHAREQHPAGLEEVVAIVSLGQPTAVIYKASPSPR